MKTVLAIIMTLASLQAAAAIETWVKKFPNGSKVLLEAKPCIINGVPNHRFGTATGIIPTKDGSFDAIDGCFVQSGKNQYFMQFNSGHEWYIPMAEFKRVQ